jgi:hypothetical protein
MPARQPTSSTPVERAQVEGSPQVVDAQRQDVGEHRFADEECLQRFHGVLPDDVKAAARHLLGEDRSFENSSADDERDGCGEQHAEQRTRVVGELEGKDDRRDRRQRDA